MLSPTRKPHKQCNSWKCYKQVSRWNASTGRQMSKSRISSHCADFMVYRKVFQVVLFSSPALSALPWTVPQVRSVWLRSGHTSSTLLYLHIYSQWSVVLLQMVKATSWIFPCLDPILWVIHSLHVLRAGSITAPNANRCTRHQACEESLVCWLLPSLQVVKTLIQTQFC